jgi:predicted dehydrogenase
MNPTLRYIIVGTGGHGAYWCSTVLPRLAEMGKAVCVAAVDLKPENLENARKHLKLAPEQCHTVLDEAMETVRADFAIVVVPPAHHESVIDAALHNDLHILSEKPIADTMEATARIYHKVKKAGKKMAVTMSHRFDQDKQTLEKCIKSNDYGRLNYVVCRFTHNCRKFGSWGEFRHKIPDALLVEGTVHHFDCFRALAGGDAARVFARTWNPPWGEFAGDSTALVTIEMTNGVKCFYEGAKANASTMNGWTNEYFRAECENGTLELDRRWLRVLRGGAWEKPLATDLPMLEQPAWKNPWLAEMFCDWLQGGPEHPANLEDNIQCSALLFAAIESAHTGQPIDVQEYLRRHLSESSSTITS